MKKRKIVSSFFSNLDEKQKAQVDSFLRKYREHLDLGASDASLIVSDAKNALVSLTERGVGFDTALRRLSSENLGGFYAHKAVSWYPLDDAAKVYPMSLRNGKMPIFRLSCYLNEDVDPAILQIALDFTIKRFPSFATIVRKGFFWHYLDSVKRRFAVIEDTGVPCQPLKITSVGSQSFRVLYYKNRISVEFFHVLTDGTGGLVFLKTLVAEYLNILGAAPARGNGVLDVNEAPRTGEVANEFERLNPKTEKTGGLSGPPALHMGGKLSKHTPCKVVQLVYDSKALSDVCHGMGISMTALMLSLMFLAQKSAVETDGRMMQIQVPVNMRKFFEKSETLRNFSMYCSIDMGLPDIEDLKKISAEVTRQLKERSAYDAMAQMMTGSRRLVRSVRFIPLAIKGPIVKIVYGFLGDNRFTNTLSNLGRIEMPAGYAEHISGFDFVLGTCVVSRASCALCSYGNNTVLSISKNTRDPSFEERLRALSEELGLEVQTKESPLYG